MPGTAPLWAGTTTYPSSSTYPGHQATGPKVYPAATQYPGSSLFPGQGTTPMHELLMSFDDASDSTPAWQYVTDSMRSFSITRGRENELATVDAGTETITFDNGTRAFDPTYSSGPYFPNLRPMNRVWHRIRFAGETHDLFKGYVDSYDQQWPAQTDAITVVHASDEFKVLALGHLPTTDPPRNSYAEVVQFDQPEAYWRMANQSATLTQQATVGPSIGLAVGAPGVMGSAQSGAIVGEEAEEPFTSMWLQPGSVIQTGDLGDGETPEVAGLTGLTAETWISPETLAASVLLAGPFITGDSDHQFFLILNANGTVTFEANNGTSYAVATSAATVAPGDYLDPSNWYHVAGTIVGSTISIYINGELTGSAAWSGSIAPVTTTDGNRFFRIGSTVTTAQVHYDEVAIYRYGLAPNRIAAHYAAGRSRGFKDGHGAGQRVGAILDAASSRAPRAIDPGQRTMQGRYMVGQLALDELRVAEKAEAVDAVLFIDRHGAVNFLDSNYREDAAYVAPAITFSDDGHNLAYVDIAVDYSEAYLANEWNVTPTGATTVTSSDSTSIDRYFKRSQSLTGLAVRDTGAGQIIADAMLAKYKDPMLRVTSLSPKMSDSDVLEQVFRRDIGDRIRVIRTPRSGGAPIDQQLFIQKIEVSGTAQSPYLNMVFGVSPV